MAVPEVDTSLLRAIVRNERRRTAVRMLDTASFIDAHTVERLRQDVFEDGVSDRVHAEALFAVERRDVSVGPEWRDFFVEAIVDHLLRQGRPTGVLTAGGAEWLLAQADRTQTLTAFAVLLAVLDDAQGMPPWFARAVGDRADKGWPGLAEAIAA